MATLYEKHITGDDTAYSIAMTSGDAQTFTPSTSHTVTLVKLKLYRAATAPGTITVSIRAVDGGTGLPTGADLCSGTTDGDTLTQDTGGEWREITLGAGTVLTASTAYAIYAYSAAIEAFWRTDTDNGYADGKQCTTADGGSSWADIGGGLYDLMFEEWGEAGGSGSSAPVVYTQACTDTIAEVSKAWGILNSIGDAAVTQHGHVWDTSTNPTTALSTKTTLGAAPNLGQFQSNITGLTPGTTYYVRTYATNSYGTAYGQNVTIGTSTSIGRRHWWTEFETFRYFGESGTEYVLTGTPTTSDHDGIMDWM